MADETTTVERRGDGYVLLEEGRELVQLVGRPVDDDVVALVSTETDLDRQGEGLAGRLVGAAMDDLRQRGLRVRPDCPYVAAWLERHPDQQDLVAG
ncbi:GNAT family N-acetyltransferase [Pseudokineococcus marinus]|uniref:N-acetyltransferase n=1 Tax=Pseudokineococcus marinus TaxID=351215 RepID=A0A849BSJ8_9ACTN|nr:GNAT family N-acetyltransferase [Pseudokineococcus marinus]NNH23444.1 N-acetyltransferase [Pseudokineococcus marinus]